jgi:hypothetical protein
MSPNPEASSCSASWKFLEEQELEILRQQFPASGENVLCPLKNHSIIKDHFISCAAK